MQYGFDMDVQYLGIGDFLVINSEKLKLEIDHGAKSTICYPSFALCHPSFPFHFPVAGVGMTFSVMYIGAREK